MDRKIILLEANEIPSRILDYYVAERPDSVLAKTLSGCARYETRATDTCALSPWITWPTLHRGVNNERHGLLYFGQDLTEADRTYPPVWHLLKEAGVRTGVFGPMHSSPLPENFDDYDFFVPDTFAHTPECHPSSLDAFQAFNLSMARQSPRNVSRGIDFATLGAFLLRAPFLGLKPRTGWAIAGQLFDERREGWKSTRRRTFQPVLAFDLFMAQLARKRPSFSNFFTNHVASAMHRYWAALFPEDFDELELDAAWQQRFGGEIRFAMEWTNHFFSTLKRFADRNPEYLVVMASSMGQAAFSGKRIQSQLYLRNPAALLARAGVGEDEWERRAAMDPTVSLYVPPSKAEAFEAFLRGMSIRGVAVEYHVKEHGFFDLVFGQTNIDPKVDELVVGGESCRYEDLGFSLTEVEDGAGSTGYHIPEGILVVYDPQDLTPKSVTQPASTTDVAPALLEHFGVDVPDYMTNQSGLRFAA